MCRKVVVSHIRVFGTLVMMHLPSGKQQQHGKIQFVVENAHDAESYRLYDYVSQIITVGRDVIVMEKKNNSI